MVRHRALGDRLARLTGRLPSPSSMVQPLFLITRCDAQLQPRFITRLSIDQGRPQLARRIGSSYLHLANHVLNRRCRSPLGPAQTGSAREEKRAPPGSTSMHQNVLAVGYGPGGSSNYCCPRAVSLPSRWRRRRCTKSDSHTCTHPATLPPCHPASLHVHAAQRDARLRRTSSIDCSSSITEGHFLIKTRGALGDLVPRLI
ncbi:hypothetical protein EJ04DRAFT_195412 [Polyplosphaeria fusca]|uniref:Uncharacterized protein n=1 Tax=Polyplosphaeria fusca TaxID=682080 RepID=A0A9P4R292_9PLEO|nr:hypothetical protein EJ04DRAFT_195412 [Polyplosphaeria fusca]